MRQPLWIRGLASGLGLWLSLVWAGPSARTACPMHAGEAAPTVVESPTHSASHGGGAPRGSHDPAEHPGCDCRWCPTDWRQVVLDTAVFPAAPAVDRARAISRPQATLAARLASPPHRLPFAIGPPAA